MHRVCLGIAKRFTSLWFDSAYNSKPWSWGSVWARSRPFSRTPSHTGESNPPPAQSVSASTGRVGFSCPLLSSLPLYFFVPSLLLAIELRNWLLYFAPVVLEAFSAACLSHQNLMIPGRSLHVLLSRVDHSQGPRECGKQPLCLLKLFRVPLWLVFFDFFFSGLGMTDFDFFCIRHSVRDPELPPLRFTFPAVSSIDPCGPPLLSL